MKERDLQIGDIIFFRNHYKVPDSEEEDYSYIDHVALYAGLNSDNNPTLIHSISSDNADYHPEKVSGLCMTTLRALTNQLQEEGDHQVYYDVSFHVFRSKLDPSITEKAVTLLKHQLRYRIPYDEKRLQEKIAREEQGMDDEDFKKLGEEHYRDSGIYRSIKYACRHPLPLTRTRLEGVGRGLTCSMAVVLSYQIAELLHKGLVDSFLKHTTSAEDWVSDKYSAEDLEVVEKKSQQYREYIAALRNSASRPAEEKSILGYNCWVGESSTPETFCHETFPVDSKTIGAAGLYLHMQSCQIAWDELGPLEVIERRFSPQQRESEKIKRRASFIECLRDLEVAALTRKIVSPGLSPRPSPTRTRVGSREPWFSPQFFTDTPSRPISDARMSPIVDPLIDLGSGTMSPVVALSAASPGTEAVEEKQIFSLFQS